MSVTLTLALYILIPSFIVMAYVLYADFRQATKEPEPS